MTVATVFTTEHSGICVFCGQVIRAIKGCTQESDMVRALL